MVGMPYPDARKVMTEALADFEFLAKHGATSRQIAEGINRFNATSELLGVSEDLAHTVAKLLQDARRRQEIEPNAGTEARIAEAMELLERVRG